MLASRGYDIDRFGKHSYLESVMPREGSLGGAATQATNCHILDFDGFLNLKKAILEACAANYGPWNNASQTVPSL